MLQRCSALRETCAKFVKISCKCVVLRDTNISTLVITCAQRQVQCYTRLRQYHMPLALTIHKDRQLTAFLLLRLNVDNTLA